MEEQGHFKPVGNVGPSSGPPVPSFPGRAEEPSVQAGPSKGRSLSPALGSSASLLRGAGVPEAREPCEGRRERSTRPRRRELLLCVQLFTRLHVSHRQALSGLGRQGVKSLFQYLPRDPSAGLGTRWGRQGNLGRQRRVGGVSCPCHPDVRLHLSVAASRLGRPGSLWLLRFPAQETTRGL